MSGRGLASVRLPQSVLLKLRLLAERHGMGVNDLAWSVVSGLNGIGGSQIRKIPEPPRESTNPRLSIYLGPEGVKILKAAAATSGLSPSSVLRRLLNAALTTNVVGPVQRAEKQSESSTSWFAVLIAIAAVIVFPILPANLGGPSASAQQKGMS